MSQSNFMLPDQLCYETSTPSSLGTDVIMSVVTPITASESVRVNAGNSFIIFHNLVLDVFLIQ